MLHVYGLDPDLGSKRSGVSTPYVEDEMTSLGYLLFILVSYTKKSDP